METKLNKYKNGKIYRVSDNSFTESYIGSTIQPLSRRMGGHRKLYKLFSSGKLNYYVSIYDIFDEFGIDNCANPGPRWKARYWSCRAW